MGYEPKSVSVQTVSLHHKTRQVLLNTTKYLLSIGWKELLPQMAAWRRMCSFSATLLSNGERLRPRVPLRLALSWFLLAHDHIFWHTSLKAQSAAIKAVPGCLPYRDVWWCLYYFEIKRGLLRAVQKHLLTSALKSLTTFYIMKAAADLNYFQICSSELCFPSVWGTAECRRHSSQCDDKHHYHSQAAPDLFRKKQSYCLCTLLLLTWSFYQHGEISQDDDSSWDFLLNLWGSYLLALWSNSLCIHWDMC